MDAIGLTLFEPATLLPVRSAFILAAAGWLALVMGLGLWFDLVIEARKRRR